MNDDEVEVWLTKLYGLDHAIAGKVLDRMVEVTHFRPTPGEFLAAYKAEARRQAPKAQFCDGCESGMVLIDEDANTWHPCGRCTPEGTKRWGDTGKVKPVVAAPYDYAIGLDRIRKLRADLALEHVANHPA